MDSNPSPSPTGTPRIPPTLIPWLQVLYAIAVPLGDYFAEPGPWNTSRVFHVAVIVLAGVLGMSSAGNRTPAR